MAAFFLRRTSKSSGGPNVFSCGNFLWLQVKKDPDRPPIILSIRATPVGGGCKGAKSAKGAKKTLTSSTSPLSAPNGQSQPFSLVVSDDM